MAEVLPEVNAHLYEYAKELSCWVRRWGLTRQQEQQWDRDQADAALKEAERADKSARQFDQRAREVFCLSGESSPGFYQPDWSSFERFAADIADARRRAESCVEFFLDDDQRQDLLGSAWFFAQGAHAVLKHWEQLYIRDFWNMAAEVAKEHFERGVPHVGETARLGVLAAEQRAYRDWYAELAGWHASVAKPAAQAH